MSPVRKFAPLCLAFLGMALAAHPAWAQAHNPFSVGISEGGGAASGITGWLLAQQAGFERLLAAAVRATGQDWHGGLALIGLSFAYGVFHAAGPGHGKAVVASYLMANERALKRGLVLAGLAALLQALVAIALVGVLAAVLHQSALQMRLSAQWVEAASFAGIALLGAWLVWRKGGALVAELRPKPARASQFVCDDCDDLTEGHVHGPNCGHVHMPDPRSLSGAQFAWREAGATIFAAGLRPCSGAILVLVFALAQNLFWVGVGSTLAMALGTALTTGTLAALAVLAKGQTVRLLDRFSGASSHHAVIMVRALELAAAGLVLTFGLLLSLGVLQFA